MDSFRVRVSNGETLLRIAEKKNREKIISFSFLINSWQLQEMFIHIFVFSYFPSNIQIVCDNISFAERKFLINQQDTFIHTSYKSISLEFVQFG